MSDDDDARPNESHTIRTDPAHDLTLRDSTPGDVGFLERMTYQAAFWHPNVPTPTLERALEDAEIGRYVNGWGRLGDAAVIAEVGGRAVGAAWLRRFSPNDAGYGFVAADVPELAIAVEDGARGQGTGTRLLESLLARAKKQGVAQISLSVNFDNPAANLYRRLGFRDVRADENSWTMVRDLTPRGRSRS